MKIAVTGGWGKLGRTVVAVLSPAGHEVVTLDSAGQRGPGFTRVDFTNYGETIDAARSWSRSAKSVSDAGGAQASFTVNLHERQGEGPGLDPGEIDRDETEPSRPHGGLDPRAQGR